MRLIILGASGGVGQWVTRLATAGGQVVTALVRPGREFRPPANVRVLRGSALDERDLEDALTDQDALISCLGPQRTRPWNPWAPLRLPGSVAEPAARALTAIVPSTSVRRIVVTSAAGVGDSLTSTNAVMRWMLRHSTVGKMYDDLTRMEAVLRASPLEWIAVRPVTLINAAPSARARHVSRYGLMSVIGRADVASWLLRVATADAIGDRTPMIGWW